MVAVKAKIKILFFYNYKIKKQVSELISLIFAGDF